MAKASTSELSVGEALIGKAAGRAGAMLVKYHRKDDSSMRMENLVLVKCATGVV